jgi:hypothetical protein
MKALLGLHGIRSFWSDQPAGLNSVHLALLQLGYPSLVVLRVANLAFALMLLGTLLRVLQRDTSRSAAGGGILLLGLSSTFLMSSVAVLIGLPAYAAALASAACLVWADQPTRPVRWVVASGGLLALGAHIKLSALLVAPALLVWLGWGGRAEQMRNWWRSRAVALWGIAFGAGFLLLWLLQPESFWLIWDAHWGAGTRSAFADATAPHVHIFRLMRENWFISGPALLGLVVCAVRRRREGLIPSIWFVTALGVHLWHRPFWQFHFLHLAVPMAWLTGLFIGEVSERFTAVTWEQLRGRVGNPLTPALSPDGGEGGDNSRFWHGARFSQAAAWCWVLLPSLFLSAFIAELPGRWAKETAFLRVDDSKDWECVGVMKQYKTQTKWVFADDALYPFHAGMLTPPEIAVLSNKRLRAGLITQPELLNLLVHYRAEQVLVRRHVFDEKFMRYVGQHYTTVFEHGSLQLFIRNDLVKLSPAAGPSVRAVGGKNPPALWVGKS